MSSQQFYTIALAVCNILLGILLIIVVNTKRKKAVIRIYSIVLALLMLMCGILTFIEGSVYGFIYILLMILFLWIAVKGVNLIFK